MKEPIILSLGGSIIVPDKPDHFFLREFKNFIVKNLDKYRFVIVCGGGKTNSYYNYAATRVSNINDENLDWLGIAATRLNAELIRVIFGDLAEDNVVYDPTKKIDFKKDILVASGWKPGWSTDYDAVELAKQFGAKRIINLTNIEYVYDKDPKKYDDAKVMYELKWSEYKKIIGSKWKPRMNSPFDPIASKLASKLKIKVAILKGTDLRNLEKYINGLQFKGTLIG